MQYKLLLAGVALLLLSLSSCTELFDLLDHSVTDPIPIEEDLVSGLVNPNGLLIDDYDRLWVAEQGSGNDDGRVLLVTEDGSAFPVVEHLPSTTQDGEPAGPTHLAYRYDTLYVAVGLGSHEPRSLLYKLDVTHFRAGDDVLSTDRIAVEDLGPFVIGYDLVNDTDESNIYNMTFGPEGDLFIADAAANAVIRRTTEGELSIVAELPFVPNPTEVGPPVIQPVPTGIIYYQEKLLVSTLSGFPFVEGLSRIYKVGLSGDVSVWQDSLTSTVEIAQTPERKIVALQYATFDLSTFSFAPETGKLVGTSGSESNVILSDLNFPTGIVYQDRATYFITGLKEGKIIKVSREY